MVQGGELLLWPSLDLGAPFAWNPTPNAGQRAGLEVAVSEKSVQLQLNQTAINPWLFALLVESREQVLCPGEDGWA